MNMITHNEDDDACNDRHYKRDKHYSCICDNFDLTNLLNYKYTL